MTTELITIDIKTPIDLFTKDNGYDSLLDAIKTEVKKFIPDISTKKGREDIASLAYKVAKTKTYIDKLGASLTEDMKKQVKVVDVSRGKIWNELETLQNETRKPLTDWENAEKTRVDNHENGIREISRLGLITANGVKLTLPELKENLSLLEGITVNDQWQEFHIRANNEKEFQINSLKREISEREKYLADQEELKRLKEENLKREARERDERIAREAADKATREAEEKAEKEKAQIELLAKEKEKKEKDAADKLEQQMIAEVRRVADERDHAERDALAASQRQKKAEEDLAAEKERNRLAEIKAYDDAKEAAYKKIEADNARIEKENIAREADVNHKKKINNEAMAALMLTVGRAIAGSLSPEETGKAIITAIAKGQIPHVKITY
jgi:hypothetical protein